MSDTAEIKRLNTKLKMLEEGKLVIEPETLAHAETLLEVAQKGVNRLGLPDSNMEAFLMDEIETLRDDNLILGRALESIAANTCCDTCQEAALVAKAALVAPIFRRYLPCKTSDWDGVGPRPKGSNADEWKLFVSENSHNPDYIGVQIAEAIIKARGALKDD
jgi:hypothetical protein